MMQKFSKIQPTYLKRNLKKTLQLFGQREEQNKEVKKNRILSLNPAFV